VHPIYQRLKELDPNTFEKLCFHLVKARFPGEEIRHVDGSAGDAGLDLCWGEQLKWNSVVMYTWKVAWLT
jgi:hypothetical protein